MTWDAARTRCGQFPNVTTSHLATFETVEEVSLVNSTLKNNASMWTGVEQRRQRFSPPNAGWVNQVAAKPIPAGFPWRAGEPNDGAGYENGEEDVADLGADGRFDDAPKNRLNLVLCECEPPTF
ncbi:MAG: C-type lectin domain-containing protein [Myxococcales bacterium]|nr:C-type lectin domain-containing protein [Myxococcales bacterium]